MPAERSCRLCGCTDTRACPGGCSWVLQDLYSPTGICSTCGEELGWNPALLASVGFDEPAASGLILPGGP